MKVYRVLAYLIATEVVIQSAALAFASFGFGRWIDDGGVADKTNSGDELSFTGAVGYPLHALNGAFLMPLLALALLILAFFITSVPGAVAWATIITGLVLLQVLLGFASHSIVGLGPIHGINAFAIFVCAIHAARRLTPREAVSQPEPAAARRDAV